MARLYKTEKYGLVAVVSATWESITIRTTSGETIVLPASTTVLA